jgi:hypothetical protein
MTDTQLIAAPFTSGLLDRDEAAKVAFQIRYTDQLGRWLASELQPDHVVTLTFDPCPRYDQIEYQDRRRRAGPARRRTRLKGEFQPSQEHAVRLFEKR